MMLRRLSWFAALTVAFAIQMGFAQEPVRVLLVSAPFGSGHNSAANRIKDVVLDHYQTAGRGSEVLVKNSMDFAPQWWTDLALRQFNYFQSTAPILYSWSFETYLRRAFHVQHAGEMQLFRMLRISPTKMDAFVAHEAFSGRPPHLVISTFPAATEALIHLRHKGDSALARLNPTVPLVHVQTDNASQDRYFHLFAQGANGQQGADVVLVPSIEVFEHYKQQGFTNVVFTGMPLKLKSSDLPSLETRTQEKRVARQELGIPQDQPTIMIEAGKNGAANYAVIIASLLLHSSGSSMNIIAACGENKDCLELLKALEEGAPLGSGAHRRLMSEMKELYQPVTLDKLMRLGRRALDGWAPMTKEEASQLITTGLPKQMKLVVRGYGPLEPLRAAADIVLTKPGGLSTAELGAEGQPMVILQEYASGEALPNGPLFERKGLAILNRDIRFVGDQVWRVLEDSRRLEDMYEASRVFRRQFDLRKVIPIVEQALKNPGALNLEELNHREFPDDDQRGYQDTVCRKNLLRGA